MLESPVHRTAIDGSAVAIRGAAPRLATPITSTFRMRAFGTEFELTAGVKSFGREFAVAAPEIRLTEELAYQSGVLRTGQGKPDGFNTSIVAVWEGLETSVFMYTVGMSMSQVLGVLDLGTFTEYDDGASFSIRPEHAGDATITLSANCVFGISDVGVAGTMRLTPETARQLPDWRGTQVLGGELFVHESHGPDGEKGTMFYLAGETSVLRVSVAPERSPSRVLEVMSSLSVSWT